MLQLSLPEEFKTELQKTIGDAYRAAIAEAQQSMGVHVEYLSKKQVMELYDISNNTLMSVWVPNGLEIFRVSCKIYFSRKKINDFISQHQV